MEYSFNTDHAEKYGVDEAIIIRNLLYWVSKNKANGVNEYDGYTYTYNSIAAFRVLFPFWSERQIGRILKSLEAQNVVKIGNYNKAKYDRTKWYAFVDYQTIHQTVKSNNVKGKKETTKPLKAITEKVEPIPYTKTTDTKPNTKTIYTECVSVYDAFCLQRFDSPAKINGAEGNALKQTIGYLKKSAVAKGFTEDTALDSFKYILNGWDKLEPFLQKQIKLTQINSNLTNIINQLKNGTGTIQKGGSSLREKLKDKYA
tara:strand:+ start:2466 stop:3239 length:774 start_codon:yes stop_codon:yes gene_type:complete